MLSLKKKLINKLITKKHTKLFKNIRNFNFLNSKMKSYHFCQRLKNRIINRKMFYLMFYYFFTNKYYQTKKHNKLLISKKFHNIIYHVELRLDVIILHITYCFTIKDSALLIKKGLILLNNKLKKFIITCKLNDKISIHKYYYTNINNNKLLLKINWWKWNYLQNLFIQTNKYRFKNYIEINYKILSLIIIKQPYLYEIKKVTNLFKLKLTQIFHLRLKYIYLSY